MLTAIIILVSMAQILLSLFVLLRARSNLSNRLFFFIGLTTLGWALANYLSIVFLESSFIIYIVRITMFFVVLQNACFYLFARTFPDTSWRHSRKGVVWYGIFTFIAAAAALSPFVFTSIEIKNGSPSVVPGPAILIFMLHAGFSIIMAFKALIAKTKVAVGVQKSQLHLLLFGSTLIWVIVPITNFALTPLLKTTFFIVYGPLYTLAFASIIAFSMLKHKLFDIRFFVLRGTAYTFSMLLVTGLYVVPVVFLTALLTDIRIRIELLVFAVILSVLLAVFYEYIKNKFNALTYSIFLRGYYEPQEVLNRLSDMLVGTISAKTIKVGSSKIFHDVFRPKIIHFFLENTRKTELHHMVERAAAAHARRKIILTEELKDLPDIQQYLDSHDVALIVRLRTNTTDLGFMTLGHKDSGDIYSLRDLRFISVATDEIAISLQNALHFEEIQHFNLTLQDKVTSATRKLRETNKKLKELDETKDDFISMASHQLRTPLTSVKGYLSMVLEGDAGKVTAAQQKMLEQAYVSSQRMTYLISDLLNVSRLKTGKFVIERTSTNLVTMVQQEIAQLTEAAKGRNLTLLFNPPKDFPNLMLDETKTRQLVMNFVDNAIYYTPPGGVIEINVVNKPESVELTVVDNGLGVPKRDQPHLFTKFYRANNARKARPDGTGLGLFMAKKVVIAQGGAIIFKSQEGKGSTFGFTFPKTKELLGK